MLRLSRGPSFGGKVIGFFVFLCLRRIVFFCLLVLVGLGCNLLLVCNLLAGVRCAFCVSSCKQCRVFVVDDVRSMGIHSVLKVCTITEVLFL